MKQSLLLKRLPLIILLIAFMITMAFAQHTSGGGKSGNTDTIPKKQKQVRDLDEALAELDKGEAELQKAMKDIDFGKIERDVRDAMKNAEVDMAKAREEMAKAMKEIDFQKMEGEMQKALADAQKELAKVDVEKIRREVQASLATVDMKQMKTDLEKARVEMEKLKDIDMTKMRKELAEIRPQVEKSLQEAKRDIEKARQEMTAYKNLVNALDRDGYLDKEGSYKVEYKNGGLTVNGKSLSADAVKKYDEFLNGKKDFTLNKAEDGLNINQGKNRSRD